MIFIIIILILIIIFMFKMNCIYEYSEEVLVNKKSTDISIKILKEHCKITKCKDCQYSIKNLGYCVIQHPDKWRL